MKQVSRLEETWHHPYGEAWWWQHHAVGMFFSGREWEASQEHSTERSLMKTCSRVLRTSDWGEGSYSIELLWRDLKIVVQRHSPSILTEFKRISREEWEKLPKCRCAKLVVSYPRRLEAVLAAKGME